MKILFFMGSKPQRATNVGLVGADRGTGAGAQDGLMQTLVQVVCSKGSSLRDAITNDRKLANFALVNHKKHQPDGNMAGRRFAVPPPIGAEP